MKAFEEWRKEHCIESGRLYDVETGQKCEKAWRGALEWTLPIIERLGQEACYDIEEELEDG